MCEKCIFAIFLRNCLQHFENALACGAPPPRGRPTKASTPNINPGYASKIIRQSTRFAILRFLNLILALLVKYDISEKETTCYEFAQKLLT